MSVIVKNFVPAKYAENAQTTQYTAVNVKAIIDKFTITNVSGANVTFAVNLVPAAGTAGLTNLVLAAKTLLPNETYTCPEMVGHVLESGSFISTIAGTASAIVLDISGREISSP